MRETVTTFMVWFSVCRIMYVSTVVVKRIVAGTSAHASGKLLFAGATFLETIRLS
jgi:hypothetical protein